MLYISTRNSLDTYTAHHALFEERAADGGYYTPFYLPSFSSEDLCNFKRQPVYETVSEIINLFFSLRLCAADIESVLGAPCFESENMNQNLTVVELWHTPEENSDYIFKKINYLMTGNAIVPSGWACIAIKIALLFGLLGCCTNKTRIFDVSVTADNLADVTAIIYAKAMGLPVNMITCACDDNSVLWDLVNRGECSTSKIPAYMELFLYKSSDNHTVTEFLDACNNKKTYFADENLQQFLNSNLYPAVVSTDRADSIISGLYRSNQYILDHDAALAYGSLQDYRAMVGANNSTIIFSKKRPECTKE